MIAHIYDKNDKIIKGGILKGEFKENHFIYKEGGNWIRKIPLIGTFLGFMPIIGNMINPHEKNIECDFEECFDEGKDYLVNYRKLGDRYEQIPIKRGSMTASINLQGSLQIIELAQARFDANVKPPEDISKLLTMGLMIIAIIVLLGVIMALQSLGTAIAPLNNITKIVMVDHNAVVNITRNLSITQKELLTWFQLHGG